MGRGVGKGAERDLLVWKGYDLRKSKKKGVWMEERLTPEDRRGGFGAWWRGVQNFPHFFHKIFIQVFPEFFPDLSFSIYFSKFFYKIFFSKNLKKSL